MSDKPDYLRGKIVSRENQAVKCLKCGRLGTRQFVKIDGATYTRIWHTEKDICLIGKVLGSFEDARKHFGWDRAVDAWPKTIEQYQAIFNDITKFAATLIHPRYGNSRFSLRNHLLAKIPNNFHKSKEKQLEQYDEALKYIISFVKGLDESNWGHLGKSIRPRLIRILKSWGVWNEK